MGVINTIVGTLAVCATATNINEIETVPSRRPQHRYPLRIRSGKQAAASGSGLQDHIRSASSQVRPQLPVRRLEAPMSPRPTTAESWQLL